jgi:ABC-2 type transport system permease protein
MFWTMIFPTLILGTLFGMAFSNLSEAYKFETINIAVVNNDVYQKDENFKKFLSDAAQGDDKLFNVTAASKEEAENLLDNDKIDGYLIDGPHIQIVIKNSDIGQSIIKSAIDQYSQALSTINTIAADDPSVIPGIIEKLNDRADYTRNVPLGTKEKPDSSVNYFYTLIAMACFYGASFGLKEITDTQADLSKRAARLNVAPVHKLKTLLAGLLAGYIVLIFEILILICYLIFVMKVDFGNQIGYIALTCLVGSGTGISFGAFIAAAIKKGEGVKTGILVGATMVASYFAGMMGSDSQSNVKYLIQKNIPVLSYLNPVALITDSLYALYYYDTHTRFLINIGLLSGFTVLFCLLTYMIIRRQRYASI